MVTFPLVTSRSKNLWTWHWWGLTYYTKAARGAARTPIIDFGEPGGKLDTSLAMVYCTYCESHQLVILKPHKLLVARTFVLKFRVSTINACSAEHPTLGLDLRPATSQPQASSCTPYARLISCDVQTLNASEAIPYG